MRHESIVVRSLPFGVFVLLLALEPVIAGALPGAVDPRWLYGVQAGAAGVALLAFWGRYVELTDAPRLSGAQLAWAVGVGAAVFVAWINLDRPPFTVGEAEGFDPTGDGGVIWPLALMRLAGAALIVPVMEELFWRSFILRWLERRSFLAVDPGAVGWGALAISSAVFALEHRLWLAGLLAGLAYGWLYKRTRNLWAPVVAHAVTNGLLGAWVLWTGSWTFW